MLKNFLETYREQLQKTKEALVTEPMPQLTDELFLMYERCGNRIAYENVYFARRKRLTVYGVLAVLDAQAKDIQLLESVLKEICMEKCWALPAHVDRNMPGWEITIDLFAAETACTLAELTGRLEKVLSPSVVKLVRDEVYRRVLEPFIHSTVPYSWWEHCHMNWCAVCNGAIGCTALWMMEEGPDLDAVLDRICDGIRNYLDGFSQDGACLEGLGYYTYGMSFYVAFAELLSDRTGGRMDLLKDIRMKNIALFQQKCYLPGGKAVCFADCEPSEKYRMGLTCYLKLKFSEAEIPDLEAAAGLDTDPCYRYMIISRDFLFTQKYLLESEVPTRMNTYVPERERWLPDAQWAVKVAENGACVAAKGGHNDEPHNHNDVGSFYYMADGEMVLADLGCGEYTKSYFNEHRYEYLTCRSLGHNVPLIDGNEQCTGRQYCATEFFKDDCGNIQISYGGAYGLDEQEAVRRKIIMDMKNGELKVEDFFSFQHDRTVTENLVVLWKPEIVSDGFCIRVHNNIYQIVCVNAENKRIESLEYANHSGVSEKVWMLQWDIAGNGTNKLSGCRIKLKNEV